MTPATRDRAIVSAIVLAGFALRAWHLDSRSMWFDEAVAWRTAILPVTAGIRAVAEDVHVPGYFLLLKAWMLVFGESLWALRSLSVVFGLIAIAGAHALAQEILPQPRRRLAGILAAALIACSWFHIHYSAEARMYSMMSALALWSSVALFRAMAGRGALAYCALAVLSVFTHPLALFFVAAQAVFWLFADRSPASLRRFAALYGIVAAAFAPWLLILLRQSGRVAAEGWMDPPSLGALARSFDGALFHPDAFPPSPLRMWIGAAASVGVLLALVTRRAHERERGDVFAVHAVVAPLVLAGLASVALGESLFIERYVMAPQTMLLFALAALLSSWEDRFVAITNGVACVAVSLMITFQVSRALDEPNRPGARAAAEWLASQREPGELAVVTSPLLYMPFQYYARDTRMYTDGAADGAYYFATNVIAGEERVRQHDLAGARERAWVINSTGGWSNWTMTVPETWEPVEAHAFPEVFLFQGDVMVTEYRIRPTP